MHEISFKEFKRMLSRLFIDSKVNNSFISKVITFTYRLGNSLQYTFKNKIAIVFFFPIYKCMNFFFITVIAGAEIPDKCKIGNKIKLKHGAKGVIIHPDVIIGDNLRIYQQVTIGANTPRKPTGYGVPKIGNNVFIGAGAKIIGPITIGDNVIIGANAVVVCDVPSNHTAIGIPAKIIKPKSALL
jgi:serine O-acetyltransferase